MTHKRLPTVTAAACVLAASAGVIAGPALAVPAAAAAVTAGTGTQSVTLVLSAPNRSGLRALAGSTGLTRAERVAKLGSLVPSTRSHQAVATALRQRGLTVRSSSTWTVTATGSDAAVAAAFGRGSRTSSLLPKKPAALAPYVSSVRGGNAGSGSARRPLGVRAAGNWGAVTSATLKAAAATPTPPYTGPALRTLYGQSIDGSPGGGAIATIQFDGWNSSALTTYAQTAGLPAPQLTEISVNGRSPRSIDQISGSLEVALDQESLLGVSPHSAQRAYFTDNSDAGSLAALSRIASDATDVAHNYYGLVAMSSSWGLCEAADTARADEEPILESIVAAGVTVFASTGDSGAYDCQSNWGGNPVVGVDYPASSPVVVGVGGTKKTATAESGWGDGGGGISSAYPRPAYQAAISTVPGGVTPGNHRLVPDIAAVADPDTGFAVYNNGSWSMVGGTSLAAPAMAGMLTNVLGGKCFRRGIGDIHSILYQAPTGDIHDVTTGGNDLYTAGVGYDLSTGLGSPRWDALSSELGAAQRGCLAPWGGTTPRPTRPPHWGTPGT